MLFIILGDLWPTYKPFLKVNSLLSAFVTCLGCDVEAGVGLRAAFPWAMLRLRRKETNVTADAQSISWTIHFTVTKGEFS